MKFADSLLRTAFTKIDHINVYMKQICVTFIIKVLIEYVTWNG